MAVQRRPIPDSDHIVRYVSYARQARDEHDNLIGNGLLGSALQLKTDEVYVSVNWLEFEPAPKIDCIKRVRNELSSAFPPKPRSKALLAIGNVGKIKSSCAEAGYQVRVTHEPTKNSPSHSGIRRLPIDNDELLDALAAEVFTDTISIVDI